MNILKIFLGFLAMMVLSFFAIGFADTVQEPTDTTALAQYNNLSQAVEISGAGVWGTMLLLILIMVLGAILILAKVVRK